MSERVEFGVFEDRDKWVVSVKNRLFYEEDGSKALMAAGELAETLNSREEELEKLRAENESLREVVKSLESRLRSAREAGTPYSAERDYINSMEAVNSAQASEIGRLRGACRQAKEELLRRNLQNLVAGDTADGGAMRAVETINAAIADKEPTQ